VPSPTLIRAVEQWGGASAVPVAAALGGAGGGARRARRQRAVALRFVGAPGVLLGPLYRQPRRWSGAGGAGERDGTRRRVAGGAVRGSLPLYRVNDGRRRSVSVRGSLGTAACERLERDRRRARERPVARAGASLVRARRAARGGVLGSGPAQRGAERDRAACEGRRTGPGQARCVAGAGSKAACPGGKTCSAGARSGGAGGRRGWVTRAAEKKGRRERGKEREKEKEKEKKMEKEKWREKKRGREMDPRRDHGADRGAGRPRLASGRARARRAGRGETGCRIRVSGLWGIGRSGGTGRIPENWG